MSVELFDVVVVGAGVSGICAALGARRQGASVLLVEKTGMTGGAITLAGINAPAMFNGWGKQIIGGIGWELVTKALGEEGKPIPDVAKLDAHDHVGSAIWINPLLFEAVCEEELQKAGVEISLHTMPCQVTAKGAGWMLQLVTKEGIRELGCRMLVDCTGDGDLVRLLGIPCLPFEECQPGTSNGLFSGYDPDKVDYDALGAKLQGAIESHQLELGDVWWCGNALPEKRESRANMWKMFLGRHGINANHISMRNPDQPGCRTAFELEGRAALLRVWRFLKKQPGFEHLTLEMQAPECGCRESRRVETEEIVMEQQYLTGYDFPEKIAHSFYPIDLHDDHCGLQVQPLPEGVIPSVPRGALLPKGQQGILVAGRIIGSDRLANSALRIQATCMATGQAAGVWAALTVEQVKKSNDSDSLPNPRTVSYADLKKALVAQKAILL